MAQRSRPVGSAGARAEDLVAAVRVHADRVHDAVRRVGCPPQTAADVVENSALDLVDAVAERPDGVGDLLGWWFARARALGRSGTAPPAELPRGGGLLSTDADQEVLAAALEALPERDRFALLLRDSYDLPDGSVAAALGTGPDEALELVGRARLDLLRRVDGAPPPAVPEHQGRLSALARIAEGGALEARDATPRRHALSCADCRALVEAQSSAHLLLTGLSVAALPETDRAALLARVEAAAHAALPSSAEQHLADELEDEDEDGTRSGGPSPLLVLLGVVVACVLGLVLGLLLTRAGAEEVAGAGTAPDDVQLLSPPPPAPSPTGSPPTPTFPTPETSVFTLAPPEPSPTPSPTPPPAAAPGVAVAPAQGPDGTRLTVTGTGWPAGAEVLVEYLDPTGRPTGSQVVVPADPAGGFSAGLVARDPAALPGRHVVRASNGELSAEAVFTATP